ncbi:MAG: TlpA disulfide reductase family protein [Halothiobacillaceae bacterium]|nr:TlpA disulfide reductase family protein [Halothiobacillaceae bacterium]
MLTRRRFLACSLAISPFLFSGCASKDSAPDASLAMLDAPATTLAALRGQPVLLTFWATSCPGCIEEIPLLSELHKAYAARGLRVIGVAMNYDKEAQIRALRDRLQVAYPLAWDKDGSVSTAMGTVRLTPTTFLLDPQGQVVYQKIGIFDLEKVKGLIEGMLGKS